jgi:hypothetical protein
VYSCAAPGESAAFAELDHLAAAQHHDAVGDLRDDGEIVGDVERRGAVFADQLAERGQHLDLRRHVERGRRLVEHDDVGPRAIAIAAIARCNWPPETSCG